MHNIYMYLTYTDVSLERLEGLAPHRPLRDTGSHHTTLFQQHQHHRPHPHPHPHLF